MSNNETCPPLRAVIGMANRFPGVYDRIEELVNAAKNGEIPGVTWDYNLCYCPVAAAISATGAYEDRSQIGFASYAVALAAWRREKMIYTFDETLAAEVISMSDDITVPLDILYCLPVPCLFIEFPSYKGHPEFPAGFFVSIDDDPNQKRKELRLHYIYRNGDLMHNIPIHLLPGKTIGDGITDSLRETQDTFREMPDYDPRLAAGIATYYQSIRKFAIEAVHLVLYICAENAEIEENESQKKIYRKPTRTTDRFREIRKWDVGVKTGEILRKIERDRKRISHDLEPETEAGNTRRNSPPRPHVRRAHWHHFWTGSGTEKKLILRWVNSTLVGTGSEDSSIIRTTLK